MTPSALDRRPVPETRSRLYWILEDTRVLTFRSLKHMVRHMDQLLGAIMMPIMFLLLFRYVFGGAIDTGGTSYANFLVAGILVQNLAFGASTTALNLVVDMSKGIVDRFRSLPMGSGALLVAHVTADLARNVLMALITIAVGLVVGFRPVAGPREWLLVLLLTLVFTFAISWLSAIMGLLVKTMEAVQWMSFVLIMPLTFVSSAFVPTSGMPGPLRVFAENQPITLVINAIRAWLVGIPLGNQGWLAFAWCAAIIAVSMPVAAWMFRRRNR
jgi:ABC-2 type transport system permease protein